MYFFVKILFNYRLIIKNVFSIPKFFIEIKSTSICRIKELRITFLVTGVLLLSALSALLEFFLRLIDLVTGKYMCNPNSATIWRQISEKKSNFNGHVENLILIYE